MVSDHSVFVAKRFMGGLSASMYFFAVSRWMPTSLATPRIDSFLRFAFGTAFHLVVWSGVGFLCRCGNHFADSGCTVFFEYRARQHRWCRSRRRVLPGYDR